MNSTPDQRQLWELKFRNKEHEHFRGEQSLFAEMLVVKYFKPGIRVLELGCGNGRDSQFFSQNNADVLATDFSQTAIEQNKKLHPSGLNWRVFDMSQGDWTSLGIFDVVYAFLSLHYFSNEKTAEIFQNIYKILNDKGLLAFVCKSNDPARQVDDKEVEPGLFIKKGHLRHYFSEEYVHSLLADGFDIELLETRNLHYVDRETEVVVCIARKND